MADRKTALRQRREYFSDLPQPPQAKKIETTEPPPGDQRVDTSHIGDSYLSGLERYIDALSEFITKIQAQEVKVTDDFANELKKVDEKKKPTTAEEWEKYNKTVQNLKNKLQNQLQDIKARRKQFRDMLFEAQQERKRLLDAMQLQKDDEFILRKKMARIGVLPEGVANKFQRKIAVRDLFSIVFLVIQTGLIILFATCTQYLDAPNGVELVGTANRADDLYTLYVHVALWVFVGMGLLLSYLKKYGFSGLGYTFMLGVFAVQWAILVRGFFDEAGQSLDENRPDKEWEQIPLGIDDLIHGLYGATAALVGIGAILGKTTPLQQIIYVAWFIPVYGLNHFVGTWVIGASDLGGSIFVFVFGSLFGLAYAWWISGSDIKNKDIEDKDSRYDSDILSLLGTVCLFVLWPSFNAAFAPDATQYRVIINTVLSLCCSVVFGFVFSRTFRGGKFKMSDIQRATLAGGVGIASCSSFVVGPGGALAIGAVSGGVAAVGFVHVAPQLAKIVRLDDTMGVLSTFAIPGIIGAISGIVASAVANERDNVYGLGHSALFPDHAKEQAGYNLAALLVTIGIAVVGAIPLGAMMWKILRTRPSYFYTDEVEWEVPLDFEGHQLSPDESDGKR